ncbi:polysaccharide deacetylase family protein [bacterium]|nr:MAG: polysaccharide deacetylase family protein [bacterium]
MAKVAPVGGKEIGPPRPVEQRCGPGSAAYRNADKVLEERCFEEHPRDARHTRESSPTPGERFGRSRTNALLDGATSMVRCSVSTPGSNSPRFPCHDDHVLHTRAKDAVGRSHRPPVRRAVPPPVGDAPGRDVARGRIPHRGESRPRRRSSSDALQRRASHPSKKERARRGRRRAPFPRSRRRSAPFRRCFESRLQRSLGRDADAGNRQADAGNVPRCRSAKEVASVGRALTPILCYHKVGPESEEGRFLNVSPERLAGQVAWLKRRYRIVRLRDLDMNARQAVLTFDDAYLSACSHGLEVLDHAGVSGTFFAVAGKLGGRSDWDGDRARPLAEADTLRLMSAGGHEIGNHTLTHPRLPALDASAQRREIVEADRELSKLGLTPKTLCYPWGAFDETTLSVTREVGYVRAVSLRKGLARRGEDLLCLRRVAIGFSDTVPMLVYKLLIRGRRR